MVLDSWRIQFVWGPPLAVDGVGEGLNKSSLVSMAETGFTVLARAQEEPDCLSPKKPSVK